MTEFDKCVANRFSQSRVPSNDNDGFTGPAPRSQTDLKALEGRRWVALERNQRDPPISHPVRVSDGPEY
jgi:hypothetical protein